MSTENYVNLEVRRKFKLLNFFFIDFFYFLKVLAKNQGTACGLTIISLPLNVLSFGLIYIKTLT